MAYWTKKQQERVSREGLMSNMDQTAKAFFEACEAGKGWDTCKEFCKPDAAFSCQADALAEVRTVQAYADWMKGLFGPIPDGA